MHRAAMVSALCLTVLAASGCGGDGGSGPAPVSGERDVEYVNQALGFGLDPVPGWSAEEGEDHVTFSSPDGTRSFTVEVSEAAGESLSSVMEGAIAAVMAEQPDARVLDQDRTYPVNLRDGLRAKLRLTNELGDRNLDLIVASEAGLSYVMKMEGPWIDVEGSTILGNFVSSFRFF